MAWCINTYDLFVFEEDTKGPFTIKLPLFSKILGVEVVDGYAKLVTLQKTPTSALSEHIIRLVMAHTWVHDRSTQETNLICTFTYEGSVWALFEDSF